jgi:hypothetical protein
MSEDLDAIDRFIERWCPIDTQDKKLFMSQLRAIVSRDPIRTHEAGHLPITPEEAAWFGKIASQHQLTKNDVISGYRNAFSHARGARWIKKQWVKARDEWLGYNDYSDDPEDELRRALGDCESAAAAWHVALTRLDKNKESGKSAEELEELAKQKQTAWNAFRESLNRLATAARMRVFDHDDDEEN